MTASRAIEGDLRFVVQLCREVPAGSVLVLRAGWNLTQEELGEISDVLQTAVPDTEVVVLGPGLSLEAVCPPGTAIDAAGHSRGRISDTESAEAPVGGGGD